MKNNIIVLLILTSFLFIYCGTSKKEMYPGERDNLPSVSGYLDEVFDNEIDNQLPEDFQADSNDGKFPIAYLGNKKYSISTNLFYTNDGKKMTKFCYGEYELIDINNPDKESSFKLLNFSFKDSKE